MKDEFHVPTRIAMLAFIVLPPFLLAFFGAVSFVNAIFFAGTFGGIIRQGRYHDARHLLCRRDAAGYEHGLRGPEVLPR